MRLNAKARIALGQIGLLTSILLGASFLGLIPDQRSAIREGRAALAEALAANSSALVTQRDLRRLTADLELIVERSADLLSAGLRTTEGRLIATVGPHADTWLRIDTERSSDSQVKVPIRAGSSPWGHVELRFRPLHGQGWFDFATDPLVLLIGFVGVSSFGAFYLYLGRMLKHLDPSRAIPGRVRSALDTMVEGLVVLDGKGQIALANKAFGALLGKDPDKLLGADMADLPWSDPNGRSLEAEECPWRQALSSGQAEISRRIHLMLDDGSRLAFMVNCSPVPGDGSRRNVGVLVSLDDVTRLEAQERELLQSKRSAEEASRAKSAFLANMSHEIRTPMNAILGFTELLRRGLTRNETESRQHLETVYSSGKHLLDLINDILDLSKVESGRFEVEQVDCDPYRVIREVVSVLGVKAGEKGISLELRVEGTVPERVMSDPGRLRQVATNLIGNAIKFTDEGGVHALVRVRQAGEEIELEMDVVDTGFGMSADALNRIFDVFVQADSSVTRQFGGTGLGLSISREFARALGGDITVESEPGVGSTFRVRVLAGAIDGVAWVEGENVLEAEIGPVVAADETWAFPPARILVVDDSPENRDLVRLVLRSHGLGIDEAENGEVGLRMSEEADYDLVLMDVQMPVMDGFTAARAMRSRGMRQPIIALTANAMKGFAQECLDAGYSDYLTKPIDIDGFVSHLAAVLGARAVPAEISPAVAVIPGERPVTSNGEASPSDSIESTLKDRSAEFAQLAKRFAGRLGDKLQQMVDAWSDRDYRRLGELAHWLRGAGGTVGFDTLTAPATRLESAASARDDTVVHAAMTDLWKIASRVSGAGVLPALTAPASPAFGETVPEPPDRKAPLTDRDSNPDEAIEPIVSRLAGNERMKPVIDGFLDRLPTEERSMHEAWAEKNHERLAEAARWLKGLGGTVGFDVFTEPAEALEAAAREENDGAVPALLETIRSLTARVLVPPP